jgi:hypothetical protein
VATISEIRRGIATNLEAVLGMQISPYMLANPTPPTAQVLPGGIDYDQAMRRGMDLVTIIVSVIVPFSTDIGSQVLLDEFMAPTGERSIKTALEADPTLGATVDDLHVTDVTRPSMYTREGGAYALGVEWTVEVLASN